MVSVKVCQKSAVSHINSTSEPEWIWFINKISSNFFTFCLQIQAILQNANVFNESFNYIMTKQLFEAVWDEFGSVQQSDQIKAIKGPRIAEFSARACWDNFIGNVFHGFVPSGWSVWPCMLMTDDAYEVRCSSQISRDIIILLLWVLLPGSVLFKHRVTPLMSFSSVKLNKVGEADSPSGDDYSQFQGCKLSSFEEKQTQQLPLVPTDHLIVGCLFGDPFATLTQNLYFE